MHINKADRHSLIGESFFGSRLLSVLMITNYFYMLHAWTNSITHIYVNIDIKSIDTS